MKSLFTMSVAVAMSVSSTGAFVLNSTESGLATSTSTSDDGLYWIQTVPNPPEDTTAILQAAASRSDDASAAPTQESSSVDQSLDCGSSTEVCPTCHNDEIISPSGEKYSVTCSAYLLSTDSYEVTNDEAVNTTRLCLEACDRFDSCLGATYSERGDCILATGEIEGFAAAEGGIERVALVKRSSARSTTSLPAIVSAQATSYSLIKPTTVYNKTLPAVSTVAAATSSASTCNLDEVSCPECHEEVITDTNNQTYKIFCDNRLYSDDSFAVQRSISPEGCLIECDEYTWCDGATFWPEPQGNCQLARGENVFPVERDGYTAFLPVATLLSSIAPATSPSRYPTNNGYTPVVSTTRPSTFQTLTSSSSADAITSTCDRVAPTCPECDGTVVKDEAGQVYTVRCNVEAVCDDIVEAGWASQQDCMDDCDRDPVCFAALWEGGNCDLCARALQNLIPTGDYPEAVVLLPDQVANGTSSPNSSDSDVNERTMSAWHSTAHPPSTTPPPQIQPPRYGNENANGLSCPNADGSLYQADSTNRKFTVQCDTGFGAATERFIAADSFEDCAAECTLDCGAVRYGPSSSCGLYTDLSVISSVTGWTAGVLIMYPQATYLAATRTSEGGVAVTSAVADGEGPVSILPAGVHSSAVAVSNAASGEVEHVPITATVSYA
ncbi:hypothetical protein KC332_g6392 [Hortaea werneckii]|uniref:Apple domain-containing protein n=2 Tax=Hortaea werneckii TaxID=91943 RepID=A0A3M7ICG1_HORWE|nr:hypothetical protein KC358_g11613 [Hortaea werneckii]OTA32331.1 hypothetical protein BTJ68_07584 [Hortaea werneckii EXF-2000]KAI6844713.1 hypothetical protein KC350_g4731 [Hortaea werneckii]KAI6928183.1 hypothetical protein KC341_g11687 [Hortaea werneckii]KAI6935108.1 hypothetical protein KC348_g6340 [Hortaea werneckii]